MIDNASSVKLANELLFNPIWMNFSVIFVPATELPTGISKIQTCSSPFTEAIVLMSPVTSVNDSGLLPYLQPYFEEATGYTMEVTSAGTGAAIKKGETGDADALLVHAKASEEEFINGGYGVERVRRRRRRNRG